MHKLILVSLSYSVNNMEYRTVVLHRATRGFGFVLRGAKASSPLMEITPSERCPALQYLDDVDQGGVADIAGLKKGDFLVAVSKNFYNFKLQCLIKNRCLYLRLSSMTKLKFF